jgi:hypothetical protein
MASQSKNPTANGAISNTWSNPTNAYSSDDSRATAADGGGNKAQDFQTFAFALPAGATIDGVEVNVEALVSHSGDTHRVDCRLVKTGTAQGDTKSSTNYSATTDAVRTLGSSTDKWGLTLAESDVEATNFGVLVTAVKVTGGGGAQLLVDHVQITVHYTAGQAVSITAATETDTARPLFASRINLASETDTAQALSVVKSLSISPASETDSSVAVAGKRIVDPTNVDTYDNASWITDDGTLISDRTTVMTNEDLTEILPRVDKNSEHIIRADYSGLSTVQSGDVLKIYANTVRTSANYVVLPYTGASSVSATNKVGPVTIDTSDAWYTFTLTQAFIDDLFDQGSDSFSVRFAADNNTALGNSHDIELIELDSLFSLPVPGQQIPITAATETDAAQAFDADKQAALGVSSETDTAQALRFPKLGVATETDTSVALDADKQLALGVSAETDASVAFDFDKLVSLLPGLETDSAIALTLAGFAIVPATETDSSQALDLDKLVSLSVASETDLAQVVSMIKLLSLVATAETDAAQVFSFSQAAAVAGRLKMLMGIGQ